MSTKIGKYIPQSIKKPLIQAQYIPERLYNSFYFAAANGKIPVPDKMFQQMDYRRFNPGKRINFRNPQTFTDKLQWLKYYYHNPLYTTLVDKYAVRDFVRERIGEGILVPSLGVWDTVEEIDFDKLPDRFVLKCTHDSGSVVICTDKSRFDTEAAKEKLNYGLNRNQFYLSREWPYKNVQPRIVAEEYLDGDPELGLIDYKCFCFGGKCEFILVCTNRFKDGGMMVSFFDKDWNPIPMGQVGEVTEQREIARPDCLERIIKYAEILSGDIPHVRVDFIISNGKLYFTEMTFFDSGGRKPFTPKEYNEKYGNMIKLPDKMR